MRVNINNLRTQQNANATEGQNKTDTTPENHSHVIFFSRATARFDSLSLCTRISIKYNSAKYAFTVRKTIVYCGDRKYID